jgi:putative resolvase
MKLSEYAKQQGIRYETAWRWFRDGKIKGRRIGAHTILVEEEAESKPSLPQRVAIYVRVSQASNKSNLESQAERLLAYCSAKGYQVAKVVKEIGPGVNDSRPKLLTLLEDQSLTLIVVEHKDRLTRFGFRYLETLLRGQGRALEVVNLAENGTEDLLADLTAIISSYRVTKKQTMQIKQCIEQIVKDE